LYFSHTESAKFNLSLCLGTHKRAAALIAEMGKDRLYFAAQVVPVGTCRTLSRRD
jgi:hypothetical protein